MTNDITGSISKLIYRYIPIMTWITRYNRSWLIGDTLAGFTLAIMVIPQSLAYAKIIGVPIEFGLYSSFSGVVIYMVPKVFNQP